VHILNSGSIQISHFFLTDFMNVLTIKRSRIGPKGIRADFASLTLYLKVEVLRMCRQLCLSYRQEPPAQS
jgi:hypothetical protein